MAWAPPSHKADIERLTKILNEYETANAQLKQEINSATVINETNTKKILEKEQENRLLQRKIKSLESAIKFDKIAADGIAKKFHLLEGEVEGLKYSKTTLTASLAEYKTKTTEYELILNNDRAKRLKLMHENENLVRKTMEYEARSTELYGDSVEARTKLLEKLQQFESMLAMNESQKRIIESQSQEILSLSKEVLALKEKIVQQNQHILSQERVSAGINKTVDVLQQEIYRLRKEIITSHSGHSNTAVSAAFSTASSARLTNKISTSLLSMSSVAGNISHSRPVSKASNTSNNSTISEGDERSSNTSPKQYYFKDHSEEFYADFIDMNGNRNSSGKVLAGIDSQFKKHAARKSSTSSNKSSSSVEDLQNSLESVSPAASLLRPRTVQSTQKRASSQNSSLASTLPSKFQEQSMQSESLLKMKKSYSLPKSAFKKVRDGRKSPDSSEYIDDDTISQLSSFGVESLGKSSVTFDVNVTSNSQRMESGASSRRGESPNRLGSSSGAGRPPRAKTAKSLYVSSGLGFKHNEDLDAELQDLTKGSTKQMLRKILADRYDD